MRAESMLGCALKSKSAMRQERGSTRSASAREAAGLCGVDLDCEELFEELGVGLADAAWSRAAGSASAALSA